MLFAMKALLLMPLAEQRGGSEALLLDLLSHPSPAVSWTVVFLDEGPLVGKVRELGVDASVVSAGRLRQAHRYVKAVAALTAAARENDLVLSWMPKAHLYGSPASILARRPRAWFQHGVPSRRSRMDRLITALPTNGVFAPSRGVESAQRTLWPHRRTRVVYPSVDLNRFTPGGRTAKEAREALGLVDSGPLIGMVARLQRWKGIDLLLEGLPIVSRARPDARVVIVGGSHFSEPGYPAELRGRAESLGVAESVTFAGRQDDVVPWIEAMDVVVHASYDEPFGISILEAMAMQQPVVASDSGGPLEIIDDGKNGVFFRTGDPVSLGNAVSAVLSDPEYASQLGCNGRQRAMAFDSDRFAADFQQALLELVQ
jgi:glycosyltransferase involved in cell wall biosynthesis